jgi:hypothetical protein
MAFAELIVPLSVLGVVAVLLARPSDLHLDRFAHVYEVPLTVDNRGLLRSYIWWTRCFRIGGTVVTAVAIGIISAMTRRDPPDWFTIAAIGYPIGATVGEVLRPLELLGQEPDLVPVHPDVLFDLPDAAQLAAHARQRVQVGEALRLQPDPGMDF